VKLQMLAIILSTYDLVYSIPWACTAGSRPDIKLMFFLTLSKAFEDIVSV
jgi:hypothetical protein